MSELSQEARALIDSVSTLDDPSADDRTRIRKRLAVQLGASAFAVGTVADVAGVTSKAVAASKSGLFGTAGKAALCAGALCVAGSIWLLDWHGEPASSKAPRPSVSARQAQVAAAVVPAAAPATGTAAAEPAQAVQPGPAEASPRVRRRAAAVEADAPAQAEPVAVSSLPAELSLLGRAQAALRAGNPAQALAIAREHEATFPEGVLKEERLGVAALSECTLSSAESAELGSHASARKHAQAFLAAAPSSPLAARVRKACGLE